jgi:LacI family transcriptional regulator
MKICDNYQDALRMTPQLLTLPQPPDAFFAVNDETAVGILNAVKAMGLKVPEQISICGFTNSVLSELSDPMLTSVDQRSYEMGATAMRLLLGRIKGGKDEHKIDNRILKTFLVVRKTTR